MSSLVMIEDVLYIWTGLAARSVCTVQHIVVSYYVSLYYFIFVYIRVYQFLCIQSGKMAKFKCLLTELTLTVKLYIPIFDKTKEQDNRYNNLD